MKKFLYLFLAMLGLLGGCSEQQQPSVNLFFTSDIEGIFWSRSEPHYGNEKVGGVSVLKAFLTQQTLPFVLLEGGNWFSQTPEGTLSKGDYFNVLSTALPFSGRIFTEKDLMYGWGSLSHIIKDSPAPFLLSNLTLANQKSPAGIKNWIIEEVGGVKIGIFGLINKEALQGKQRVEGIRVKDEITTARQIVQILQEQGAEVLVLLSGLGSPDEKEALTDRSLAEEVPEIDVIISSNLGQETAENYQVGKTLVVYAGAKMDSVGKVSLFFNKNKKLIKTTFEDVVLYRRDYGEDEGVESLVAEIRRTTRGQMDRPVGELPTALEGNLQDESPLGNWAADCLKQWAKTDIAIVNSDSLRTSLPAGSITQYDLYQLYPYADHVTYLTMKGDSLLQALEEGLEVKNNFAQIAGMQITYAPQAPAGKRILRAQVNGKPISSGSSYRVAVTDYMLAGGAGHNAFVDSLEFKNTHVEFRTVLRLCLANRKKKNGNNERRWRVH